MRAETASLGAILPVLRRASERSPRAEGVTPRLEEPEAAVAMLRTAPAKLSGAAPSLVVTALEATADGEIVVSGVRQAAFVVPPRRPGAADRATPTAGLDLHLLLAQRLSMQIGARLEKGDRQGRSARFTLRVPVAGSARQAQPCTL